VDDQRLHVVAGDVYRSDERDAREIEARIALDRGQDAARDIRADRAADPRAAHVEIGDVARAARDLGAALGPLEIDSDIARHAREVRFRARRAQPISASSGRSRSAGRTPWRRTGAAPGSR